jgi:hypothetical protein
VLSPKTEDKSKPQIPQIPQISQMTENKEFGVICRKNAFGMKIRLAEAVCPSPLI